MIYRIRQGVMFVAMGMLSGLASAATANAHAGEAQKDTAVMDVSAQEETERVIRALQEAVKRNSSTVTLERGDSSTVQAGDVVQVRFAASLEDGSLLVTNMESVSRDPKRKKAALYRFPEHFEPDELLAGKEEILPGLGEAVLGMKAGEKKQLVIPAEKAFGSYHVKLRSRFPAERRVPLSITMAAEDYVRRFGSFPAAGKEVDLERYFKARIVTVGETEVTLHVLAKDGESFEEPIGVTRLKVDEKELTLSLTPRMGAEFQIHGRSGRIVSVEGGYFTVDFNHPLAGKAIVLEVEAVSLTKAGSLVKEAPAWLESHDQGLAEAKKLERPAVLVLYADWCSFCKRLFAETMEDPRVKNLRDSLVWVKVNSDRETAIKQRYAQEGYPLIVLLRPDGSVAERIDGFRDGAAFSRLLKDFLAARGKVSQGR